MRDVKVINPTFRNYRERYADACMLYASNWFQKPGIVCSEICLVLIFSVILGGFAKAGEWDGGVTGMAFIRELKRSCPLKRLDLISQDDLNYATEIFHDSLSHNERLRLEFAIGFDRKLRGPAACRNVNGVSCEDHHYLDGLRKVGLMHRFVRRLCGSYVVCLSVANCTSAPKAPGTLNDQPEFADPVFASQMRGGGARHK